MQIAPRQEQSDALSKSQNIQWCTECFIVAKRERVHFLTQVSHSYGGQEVKGKERDMSCETVAVYIMKDLPPS